MKLNKKKVFTLALAVCLIAILSMSSLAWFTDDDSITNDFYVGDTDTPADEVFGIEVWEDRDTNGDGDYNEEDDAEKADGLKYETILPGEVLSKEPYLENTGIHPQFVRAIVTVTDGDVLMKAMGEKWDDAELFLPGTASTWKLENVFFTEDCELVYVYYYTLPLEAGTVTDKIFTDVVIPTGLTKEQAAKIDNFQVTILGQAIQSEHLADPAEPGAMVTTAQRAFELYWDAEGTVAGYTPDQILGDDEEDIVLDPIVGDSEGTTYEGELFEPGSTDFLVVQNQTMVDAPITVKRTYRTVALEGVTAIVNGNLITAETDNTIVLHDCDITLPEGAKLIVTAEGVTVGQVMIHNVTVNGELLTQETAKQYMEGVTWYEVW